MMHSEWNQVMFKYSQWLKGPIALPPIDFEPSRYADISGQLLLRACHNRDAHEKRMAGLSQEMAYLRKESHAHDEDRSNNRKSSSLW